MARPTRSVGIRNLNQQDAAALIGVTSRTLRDWSDAPRNRDGTYSGPDLVAYYVAKVRGSADEFENQKERLAAAQAEKVEMENAVRRGELARRADVTRFWSDCQSAARAKFLGIAPKLAPQLRNLGDANVIAAAIRAEACAALAELADYEPGGPEGMVEGDSSLEDAAAKPDRELVGRPRAKAQQRKQRGARPVAD